MHTQAEICVSMGGLSIVQGPTTMLRCGTHIRLTRREAEAFKEITDFDPAGIRTLTDLERYVALCKRYYHGTSHATKFLHWLIDGQLDKCMGLPEARRGGR